MSDWEEEPQLKDILAKAGYEAYEAHGADLCKACSGTGKEPRTYGAISVSGHFKCRECEGTGVR